MSKHKLASNFLGQHRSFTTTAAAAVRDTISLFICPDGNEIETV